jgi:tetratricopeptide (TPR) repeat protein
LYQEYLYRGLSGGEQRLLHGEVATALEALYGSQTDEIVAQLAHHYVEAGQAEKAIEYSLRAGDQARLAYANEEAIGYFCWALALLDKSSPGESWVDWRLETMKGLGRIHLGTGKLAEAEECFQEAIALGQQMRLAPRELVRLYHWLGEVLYWQGRYDERLRIGEEGLALLGDDTESVEAALMNQVISTGHRFEGNLERSYEFTFRTAQFVRRLPYSEELRAPYSHIIYAYGWKKNVEEVMEWLQALEKRGALCHDSRALGEAHYLSGRILRQRGNLRGAILRYQQALELFARIGDAIRTSRCLNALAEVSLSLGRLEKAEKLVHRALEAARIVQLHWLASEFYENIGQISLCQGDREKAIKAFLRAGQLRWESDYRKGEARTEYLLGRVHLARGDYSEALRRFQEATIRAQPEGQEPYPPLLVLAVSGLEQAYQDSKAFRTFCRRFWEEHPAIRESTFIQWFLEPAAVGAFGQTPLTHDDFATDLSPEWVWHDPFDDCSFTVQQGLQIYTSSGRELWHINWSAPRILRLVSGDLAVQTICAPVTDARPALGGLLLWKDTENYLRLDRGTMGEHDVFFGGCLGNQDVVIGRGRLPLGASRRVFLRLQRVGERVNALCSADGENWFTVGHVVFPVEDPVQVGLHAIGNIDRAVYHGAYPDGTAIRFESFWLWHLNH